MIFSDVFKHHLRCFKTIEWKIPPTIKMRTLIISNEIINVLIWLVDVDGIFYSIFIY